MGSHKSKSSKRKSSEILRSKKSRKSKKKPSRRHHSISSCSDDDSVSSISSYSSSSEEDYRSRKGGRSRSRADVKSKKKRSERRVSSKQESIEDSAPLKKKKRSKRKRNSEHKEKHQKKRRDSSISSATSDSLSCSRCQSEHSESEEVELESRSRKKIRDKSNPDKHKIKAKGSRTKSAISLSAEDHSNFNSVYQKGEEHASLNHGRRIRSVITVVEHPQQEDNEENNLSQNNEAEDKLECRSGIVSVKSSLVKKMMVQEDFVINDDGSSGKRVSNLYINQDEMKSLEGESEKAGRVIDSVVSVNATASGSNDLELILRQKALENLRKFRGKVQAESPVTGCQKINQMSLSKPEKVGNMLADQEGAKDVKVISVAGQNSKSRSSKEILHPKVVERENVTDEYKKLEPEVTKPSHIQRCDEYALSKNISDDHIKASASHDESKTDVPEIHSTMESAFSPKNPSDDNDSAGHTLPEMNSATSSAMVGPTCSIRTLEEHSSKDLAEAKDGGQFQQKTMSVMRSGEMVQVKYKVYIPKRAPALARRQLNR
ncbi:unnamed protein product [Cuscuta europaea]|uniref:Uncharacterized protein n=1 Tax=Cuscuta europaea TaxID=41803 RepID=A0A9P1EJ39_CUSEU|nr:unnamed protein product [Cuscuta europaea]